MGVGWPSTDPRSGVAPAPPRLMAAAAAGAAGAGAWASVVAGGVGCFLGESSAATALLALYSESWRCDAACLKLCRYLDLREPPHALPIKRRGEAAAPGA